MTENELKKRLQTLKDGEFQLSRTEAVAVVPAMLERIGSPDGELRDTLIYSTFVEWIYQQRLFSAKDLHSILKRVMDDQHMFYHMGEEEGDGVFTRAFSVLLLPLLLAVHRDAPYLSSGEIRIVKQNLIDFLQQEKDRRGFVPGKGWAHAIAHAADAVDELALCSELRSSDLLELLLTIQKVICDANQVYGHGEEERLGTAVISIISRDQLEPEQIRGWVTAFGDPVLEVESLPEKLIIRANVRNFIQSLYFRLQWKEMLAPFAAALEQTLFAISSYSH